LGAMAAIAMANANANATHGLAVAHGAVGGNGSFVCPAFASQANSSITIPWVCSKVPMGTTHAWWGVLCYPFWDYVAIELVLLFGALFWLRLFAQRAMAKDRETRTDSWEAASSDGSCCTGVRASLGQPFLKAHKADASSSAPYVPRSHVSQILWKGSACTLDLIKRTLLQIFQWWVLMIPLLLWLMLEELMTVHYRFGVDIKLDRNGVWHIVMPEQFREIPHWLATFSIYSFLALVVVYVVSLLSLLLQVFTHFSLQVLRCQMFVAGSAMMSLPRDVAVQVLLLPMVYAVLAAKSVTCMWASMMSNFAPALQCYERTLQQKRDLLTDVYESNFALADMYEAWALFCFGNMVAKVMQPELRKKIRLDVVRAFEDLLLIDVSVFVLVCAVGAIYLIILTWCKWRLGVDLCNKYPFVCSLQYYLVGANWCSSSIAIYNLYTIEHKFGKLDSMKKFSPNLKFWSIKLMVIVAFWASIIMVVVRDVWNLTDEQSHLLDASLRIYVMAFVAILNVKAWWPWSQWYNVVDTTEATSKHRTRSELQPLTEVGVRHVPPGTVALARQLLDMSDAAASDWQQVAERIKELDESSLHSVLHRGSQIGWALAPPAPGRTKAALRRPLMDLSHEERRDALLEHLQGFYPEV